MSEKELVQMMYDKHHKWVLSMEEAALEWGSSYSALSKLFGGKNAIPEAIIINKQIIPPWIIYKTRRMWKITDIAAWLVNTELRGGTKQ